MRRLALVLALTACRGDIRASAPRPLPPHTELAVDTSPKEPPRMLAQEPYLRAYLAWFGGLSPIDTQNRARPKNLFDVWDDYLASLGLPDYRVDLPRATQSNALMVATLARLGEALCVRAAERDLGGKTPLAGRVVFAFDPPAEMTREAFVPRFDVLHRLFLSYPAELSPRARIDRYYVLYQRVAAAHAHPTGRPALDAAQTAWAAVCTALVQHPEAKVY